VYQGHVISIIESHLSGLCFRYFLTAHGRKGIGVKLSWRQDIHVRLKNRDIEVKST